MSEKNSARAQFEKILKGRAWSGHIFNVRAWAWLGHKVFKNLGLRVTSLSSVKLCA